MSERVITQSPQAIEIDGVLYRQCGEGRKQRRAGAIECGQIKPLSAFPVNSYYTDGHGLVCQECKDKQEARYTERLRNAIVPIKVYDDVPIGADGTCRGVAVDVDGEQVPHLVIVEACRFWGLDSHGQIQRIQDDHVLSTGLTVCKLHAHKSAVPVYALRYDLVPLWLAGIETAKMRNRERAAQLSAYQRVCGQVLADYFFGTKTAPHPPAQQIPTDGTLAQREDAPVLQYLDTAFAGLENRLVDTLEQRLEARARAILDPYLRTIKQVHTETQVEVRGVVYICKYPRFAWRDAAEFYGMGWDRYAIGWTTKLSVEERLREYPGKYDIEHPEEVYVIKTDNSKLEALLHERCPRQGIRKVQGKRDVFWIAPEALDLLKQLPDYMIYEEAKSRLVRWKFIRKGAELWDA